MQALWMFSVATNGGRLFAIVPEPSMTLAILRLKADDPLWNSGRTFEGLHMLDTKRFRVRVRNRMKMWFVREAEQSEPAGRRYHN